MAAAAGGCASTSPLRDLLDSLFAKLAGDYEYACYGGRHERERLAME